MSKQWQAGIAALAVAAAATLGWLCRSTAEEPEAKNAAAQKDKAKSDSPELAAVRKTAAEFAKAFNRGDAAALARFWTENGEYVGPEGEPVRGRKAIEKLYVEFFKENPKARLEVQVETVRLLGRSTALEEGTLKLRLAGEKKQSVSRYSVLHAREKNGWRMASVREWVPDPAESVSLKDLEWLVGDWEAK